MPKEQKLFYLTQLENELWKIKLDKEFTNDQIRKILYTIDKLKTAAVWEKND